jgi:hypothetical protein
MSQLHNFKWVQPARLIAETADNHLSESAELAACAANVENGKFTCSTLATFSTFST